MKIRRAISEEFRAGFEDAIAELPASSARIEYMNGYFAGLAKLERRKARGEY